MKVINTLQAQIKFTMGASIFAQKCTLSFAFYYPFQIPAKSLLANIKYHITYITEEARTTSTFFNRTISSRNIPALSLASASKVTTLCDGANGGEVLIDEWEYVADSSCE